MQNIQPFAPTDGEIKLTTATFWRPNGKNLNKTSIKDYKKMTPEELEKEDWGVRPDTGYEVKLDRKERYDLDSPPARPGDHPAPRRPGEGEPRSRVQGPAARHGAGVPAVADQDGRQGATEEER